MAEWLVCVLRWTGGLSRFTLPSCELLRYKEVKMVNGCECDGSGISLWCGDAFVFILKIVAVCPEPSKGQTSCLA